MAHETLRDRARAMAQLRSIWHCEIFDTTPALHAALLGRRGSGITDERRVRGRDADGDHNAAGEPQQLRQPVDLPVVQRPRDAVVAVSATRQGVAAELQLSHGDDEGQPAYQRPSVHCRRRRRRRRRRHGAVPALATVATAIKHRQRQEAIHLRRRRLVTMIVSPRRLQQC